MAAILGLNTSNINTVLNFDLPLGLGDRICCEKKKNIFPIPFYIHELLHLENCCVERSVNSATGSSFLSEALPLAFVYICWLLESEDSEDLSPDH